MQGAEEKLEDWELTKSVRNDIIMKIIPNTVPPDKDSGECTSKDG